MERFTVGLVAAGVSVAALSAVLTLVGGGCDLFTLTSPLFIASALVTNMLGRGKVEARVSVPQQALFTS